MIPVAWQVQAVAVPEGDIAIRAPRPAGKTFTLTWIAAVDALLEKRRVVYTTQTRASALGALEQTLANIKSLDFTDHIDTVYRSNENLRINFKNGTWIVFVSRTATSGRGFAPDTLIVDEADQLTDEMYAAIVPMLMMSKRARMIMAGLGIPRLSPSDLPFDRFYDRTEHKFTLSLGEVTGKETNDEDVWKKANPLIGELIPVENIRRMRSVMRTWDFAREILGARLID